MGGPAQKGRASVLACNQTNALDGEKNAGCECFNVAAVPSSIFIVKYRPFATVWR